MGLALYFVLLGAVAGYRLPFVDWFFSIKQGLARSMARFCLAAAGAGVGFVVAAFVGINARMADSGPVE